MSDTAPWPSAKADASRTEVRQGVDRWKGFQVGGEGDAMVLVKGTYLGNIRALQERLREFVEGYLEFRALTERLLSCRAQLEVGREDSRRLREAAFWTERRDEVTHATACAVKMPAVVAEAFPEMEALRTALGNVREAVGTAIREIKSADHEKAAMDALRALDEVPWDTAGPSIQQATMRALSELASNVELLVGTAIAAKTESRDRSAAESTTSKKYGERPGRPELVAEEAQSRAGWAEMAVNKSGQP